MQSAEWKRFTSWCREVGERAEPPEWTTVVRYARELLGRGRSHAAVRGEVAALGESYQLRGLLDPTQHQRVQEVLQEDGALPAGVEVGPAVGRSEPLEMQSRGPGGAVADAGSAGLLAALAAIPEEEVWLAGLRSERTRIAYRKDVEHFVRTVGISSRDELRQVDRAAVLFWREEMKKAGSSSATIRRRLSALSSLYAHLVHHRVADDNPVREVARPRINRRSGKTASFSRKQARAILDAPELLEAPKDDRERRRNLMHLRDRALLSVGLQVGARRAEIAYLRVKDFHQNQGYWAIRFTLKGGTEHAVSVNPQTAQRIQDYLEAAGHGGDPEAPLFQPLRSNGKIEMLERHLHPDMIDRILKKWSSRALGMQRGFSAHSMRATFITTALDNGAPLEDVQRDVGHADPSTTKLYDRRGHNPEKSASFFANY